MHIGSSVQGTITSKDVLLHSVTILRLWGPVFYVRCIRAIASRRPCTFLEVLASDPSTGSGRPDRRS
jgi:hypothetical protein